VKNVYLFQPQYTIFFNGKLSNWIPYSVGVLWNYASNFKDVTDNFVLKDLFFKRNPIPELLDKIENPTICGFSCYIWNIEYCLVAAEEIKRKWPECVILFGGPQISKRYLSYSFIDCIVLGEGEEAFVKILTDIHKGNKLDSIVPKTRLQDLSHSGPYVSGVFDRLLEENPDITWNVTIETNRGCPYSCSFCDWGSLTYSKVKKFALENVQQELDWIRGKPIGYLMIADANFGIFKERDLELAKLIKAAADDSSVDVVNVQGAKNSTELAFEIEQILGDKAIGVTIALQSMNPDTLDAIHRKNLPINDVKELIRLSKKYNVPSYSELLLGLPLETKETWCRGLCELLEMGQHNALEIWFTQLLENSELSKPESREMYQLKSAIYVNYYNFNEYKKHNHDGINEKIELVISTSTMNTHEMTESYLYGWMIIQWHMQGYSQIISRYLRFVHNVPFRTFYDFLLENIITDEVMSKKYQSLYNTIYTYLTTGSLDSSVGGHALHTSTKAWMSENRFEIFNFVYDVGKKLKDIPIWVHELQKEFLYNSESTYPILINGTCDIINEVDESVTYSVQPKDLIITSGARDRRTGTSKNIISIVDNTN
jgi:hypothetical protein